MTKFIKLTEVYPSGNMTPVIINVDNILSIKVSDKGKDTHICMKDARYYFVRETVGEVWDMLITDNTRSPVIMTAEEALKFYAARVGMGMECVP